MPPVPVPPAMPAVAAEEEEPPLPTLALPEVPLPRLELPDLEPVAPGPAETRPLTVAGFVAAELRSIPSRWIEEATGRSHAAVAVAVAAAPAQRPAVAARVRLVPVLPEPEPEVEEVSEEAPADWPLAPAAIIRPCPLPDGAMLFGPLRSSYADGPSLLRDLARRGHSGALVTAGEGRAQAALLHQGGVLALLAVGRSGTRRLESLRLPEAGQEPEHDLTVPVYPREVAVALGRLVNLTGRYRRLHASFVRLPALLEHLAETRVTGGLRITTPTDVGVLLINGGELLGAYTARHPALEEPELVTRLCAGDAEIDVHAGPLVGDPAAVAVGRLLG